MSSNANKEQIWSSILEEIKTAISPEQYTTWFLKSRLTKFNSREITIHAPNLFCKEWLENNYMDIISSAIKRTTGLSPIVKFIVEAKRLPAKSELQASDTPDSRNMNKQLLMNKNYTFENFLVGPCNRLAHAAALAVSESPGIAYNPLFIYGPVGIGKTHLLQAICLKLKQLTSKYNLLYLPCESFINHYISTIKTGNWSGFRRKYRQTDVILIDDIHFLANSQSSREEFFHIFNAFYSSQKQIVLSSDCLPEEIPTLEERLISRFRWGLITRIDPPNFETSIAIIQRKSSFLNIDIPYTVACYIAENISSSVREIESTVLNIGQHALLSKSSIDINFAKEIIRNTKKSKEYIGIEKILNTVTKHFDVQISQLLSKRKFKSIALPRQIAMHLARKLTNLSLEEIGGYIGGRDHTTVMHADEKIRKLKKADQHFFNLLRKIEKELNK